MEKISKVSRVVKLLVAVAAIINVAMFVTTSFVQQHSISSDASGFVSTQTNSQSQLILSVLRDLSKEELFIQENTGGWGLFLGTLPELVLSTLLCWFLFLLFHLYQQGHIFTVDATQYFRWIGLLLILWPAIELVYLNLFLVGMRLLGLADTVTLTIGIGTDDLKIMATGLMLTIVAWIMTEGVRLREEQELTI